MVLSPRAPRTRAYALRRGYKASEGGRSPPPRDLRGRGRVSALLNAADQDVALDLTRRRERELVEDLDHLGQLVDGDLIAQEGHDLVERDARARTGDHAQAVALAQARIGHADDGRVQDLRMRVEDLLDLPRE